MTPTFILEPLSDKIEPLWRQFDRTGAHSFFLSWTWIGTLLRTTHARPLLLRAKRGSETVALALMTLGQGRIGRLFPVKQAWLNATGDPHVDGVMIEHNGFAGDASIWPAFIEWFARERFADELVVPGAAPEDDDRARTGLLLLEHRSDAYRTPLAALRPQGVTSILSSNARQQLRRSMRDYASPFSVDRAPDPGTALDYFEQLKALHVRSWSRRGRRHAFDNSFFEPFHRALIEAGMADGTIDLLRIRAGERVVGYLYNFRRNGVVWSYQSGFDDADPKMRPGYVCHALAMQHYAEAGETVYDFLAGANRLKKSFGTERYTLSWRHYRQPMLAFRAESVVRTTARVIKRLVRSDQAEDQD